MLIELVVVIAVVWLLTQKWKRRHFDKLYEQLKISTPRLPFIGHVYIFFCNEEERMNRFMLLGKEAINAGGITSLWLADKLYIHIADSEVADIVMKTFLEKDDIYKCFHIVTGGGSIFAPVKTWRPRRSYLAPTFSMKNLDSYVEQFSKYSRILVENLQKVAGADPIVMQKMYLLHSTNNITGSLGIDLNELENAKKSFLLALEDLMNTIIGRVFYPWLHSDFVFRLSPGYRAAMKHKSVVYEYFDKAIQEKRKQYESKAYNLNKDSVAKNGAKSFIELLIESSANVSDVVIREECVVVNAAASDTTTVSLGYITLMLARHPEMQERLYEELKETLYEFDEPITSKDLPRLIFLDAFIRETLRLYPGVPIIVRKVDKHIKLPSGVTLLPGCGALINIWAINRNPKYWGEDAEQFRPERFLESTPRHPAAFATFSHGPRNCIGLNYAMMSMKTAIATILKQYRIVPASDDLKHAPLRVKFDMVMRLVDNIPVRFELRN